MSDAPCPPMTLPDSHDAHATPIRTPRQLVTVIIAAFVLPVTIIILLVNFVALGARAPAARACRPRPWRGGCSRWARWNCAPRAQREPRRAWRTGLPGAMLRPATHARGQRAEVRRWKPRRRIATASTTS
ncbi:MAG: hypothetical protein U1F25_03540 [Rubrivivax sp.]